MAEIATCTALVGGVGLAKTTVWDPIAKKLSTSNDLDEIYTALHRAMSMLRAAMEDHQNTLERQKMGTPSKSYNEWIRQVIETEREVKELQSKHEKKKGELAALHLWPRSRRCEEMKKKGAKVLKLLTDGKELRIFVDSPPQTVIKMRAPDFTNFETLKEPLKETLEFLKNDLVKGIRILGMIGTGKSAIMRNLNNHGDVAKLFDIVLWINVSTEEGEGNLGIEQLQRAIAERLKVDMTSSNNFHDISLAISKELEDKKYLLLLDDVEDDFDIYKTGIPDVKKGSKIVLTTRHKHVCRKIVDQVVKVAYLSGPESWTMFQDIINCPFREDEGLVWEDEGLVWKIIEECGGHPLLIRAVAGVFGKKNRMDLWTDGFNSLKRFPKKDSEGIEELRGVIKFCFEDLEEDQKKCFLYGALYPEGSPIYEDNMLECWEADDFLGNNDNTKEENISNRYQVLEDLKYKSLLEEGEDPKSVTMHKCIRQVALYIEHGYTQCKYLVNNSWKLPATQGAHWNDKNWISLGNMKLDMLPACPDCGMLSTLFLQKNSDLDGIPLTFFERMESLKVLDLCYTKIGCLPSSFSHLIALKVLYLRYCNSLLELPLNIQELQSLEVLDIRGSRVKNIPSILKKLKGLRRLRVSFSSENENDAGDACFDCTVISELSLLEELVIDVESPLKWSNKVVGCIIEIVATLKEFAYLQFRFSNEVVDVIKVSGSSLTVRVPDMNILDTFVKQTSSWRDIQDFQFFRAFTGCDNSKHTQPGIPDFRHYRRYVRSSNCHYIGNRSGKGKNQSIIEVLARVDAFELLNYDNTTRLSDLSLPSMDQMRGCLVESCCDLETVLDNVTAPNLEHLYLKNLEKLQTIWSDQVTVVSVTKLKTLVLTSCHVLKVVFRFVVIQQLREIEHLTIEDCPEIVEVLSSAGDAGNVDLLPKLRELILLNLPKLENICASEFSKLPAMEKLKVRKCPALRKLPFRKDDAEKMKLVEAEKEWLDALQ